MLYEEVIPTLPLDRQDLLDFAAAVADRFNNPFVNHQLLSISLNSTSKWRARNLPSFKDSLARTGTLPVCLTMSLAAYIAFTATTFSAGTGTALCAGALREMNTRSRTMPGFSTSTLPTGMTLRQIWPTRSCPVRICGVKIWAPLPD